MAAPAPTPWTAPQYSPSDGTDGFHSLPRASGSSDFPVDNLQDTTYWLGVLISACVPVAVFILAIPIFWTFLCCRSGCCSCLCGKCKRCSDFLCGCCGKSICCPDVSHIEPEGGCCSTCMCKKDKTKLIHGGLCRGKPLTARFILIGLFIALGLVNLGVQDGMSTLSTASDDLESIMNDLGDIFAELSVYGTEFKTEGADIVDASDTLANTCSYDAAASGAALMEPAGNALVSAGKSILSLTNGFDDKLYNLSDRIDSYTSGSVYAMVSLAMLFGALFSVVGLIGAVCIELKTVCCRWSSNILALTQIVGILLMFILSFVVAIEMLLGLPLGDFCSLGPTDTLVDLMTSEIKNINQSEILSYFLLNEGSNPFDPYYDKAVDAGTEVNDTLSTYKPLFTADTMCCVDPSSQYNTSSWDLDDFKSYCEFYYSAVTNCNAGSSCTFGGSPGVCVAGAGCSSSAYSEALNSFTYVLVDEDGPVAGIYDLISFKTLNAPLTKLLDTALCTHTVDGFYILFSVHASVLVLTYVALYFVSLLRTSIVGTRCCFTDVKKLGQTEFAKTWEVEGDVEMYDQSALKNSGATGPTLRAQL